MAAIKFKTVDDYIAAQPKASQPVLEQVRSIIRKALPGADEAIAYHMPTYKLPGGNVMYFAGWKQHYSIYPAYEHVVRALGDALDGYEVQKGTIRFPLSEPVPAKLIAKIAKLLAQPRAGRKVAKSPTKRASRVTGRAPAKRTSARTAGRSKTRHASAR